MRTEKLNSGINGQRTRVLKSAVLLLLMVGCARTSFAEKAGTKTFTSPAEASSALFRAAQNDDEKTLEEILGAGKEVTSSSDEVEDKLERERFSQKYLEMHRLVQEPDGTTVLYIGAENWPFPIPLVSKNGTWYFDSKTGKQEIVFRRIGENEATAVEVCRAVATAKKQPGVSAPEADPISQYAEDLVKAGASNPENTKESRPFHGYYFRALRVSSPESGNDVSKTSGLVVVAYPAEYRSSGVMTFVVTQDGALREKDLGKNTAKLAKETKAVGPDSSWRAAD